MSWTLKSLTVCPPGEFRYEQVLPSTGTLFKFERNPDAYNLAAKIASWRVANDVPHGTVEDALADIVSFQCLRLGNHPRWCYNTDKSVQETLPKRRRSGGCSTCGR